MSTQSILTAVNNSWPEFNPSSFSPNQTYVVTTTKTLTSNVILSENITLIFAGGKIASNTSNTTRILKGNNTHIIAPISLIFEKEIQLDGSWIMDRAYPQWFGAKNNDENTDSSDAINKAIQFKRVGEVFLPRGQYYINKTINVKVGIILRGEKAYTYKDTNNTSQNDYLNQGTIISPRPNSGLSFSGNFLVKVNVSGDNPENGTWEYAYTEYHTEISNIYFCNLNSSIKNLRGILFAGCINIQYCRWKGFVQAVASTHQNYSDGKSIIHCHFSTEYVTHTQDLYAFDLQGMGDALLFKYNMIQPNGKWIDTNNIQHFLGGLALNQSLGAEICDNIINANILIKNSKGVIFQANHCEGKETQLRIMCSSAIISSCYFEKGSVPSISIQDPTANNYDISNISLENIVFAYYENEYEDENKTQPRNIERYDLQTDGKVNLSIKNSFRHWVERDWINRSAPYGMEICNNDVSSSPIDKFNNHSYLLSNRGALTTGFSVIQDHAVSTKNLTMSGATNSHVDWHKDPGTYSYSANIVWDKTRKLTTPISSTFTVENISNFGVLITLFGGDTFGYHTFIRIFRTKGTSSSFEYCDVALCGCKHLYDNGNSICGFEWKTGSQEKQVGVIPNGAIQFSGDNIICRSTSYPVVGTWTDGDIIYNTGTTTPTLWIRVNGNWIAK